MRGFCEADVLSSGLLSGLTGLLPTRIGWEKEEMALGSMFVCYDVDEYFQC